MSEEVKEKKPKAEKKEDNKATVSKEKTTSEKKKNSTEKKTTKTTETKKTSSKTEPKTAQATKSTDKSTDSKTTNKSKTTKKTNTTSKASSSQKKSTAKNEDTKKTEKKEKQDEIINVDANEDIKTELIEEIKQKKNKTQKAIIENSKLKNTTDNSEKAKEDKMNENSNEAEAVEQETSLVDESKFDTVSLKEIREALENKVDKTQRKSVIKDVFINISIALVMAIYLSIIMVISRNLDINVLEKITKIATLTVLFIGLAILEISYKKDNAKIAMNAIEVIVFGTSNLCLIYTIKLYIDNLKSIIGFIIIGVVSYYIIKSILLALLSIRKFKNENNDIKDIVAKKKKEED